MNLLFQVILTFVLLHNPNSIFESNPGFNKKIAQTIRYPRAAREANIEELVYISLSIDEVGELDRFSILQDPHPILKEEVNRSFNLIQKSWKKSYLNDKKPGQEYLVILEFVHASNETSSIAYSLFERANKEFTIGNMGEALELLNECIALNPYHEGYFTKRSEAQRSAGNLEAAQLDYLRAKKLKDELLTHLYIKWTSI